MHDDKLWARGSHALDWAGGARTYRFRRRRRRVFAGIEQRLGLDGRGVVVLQGACREDE